MEKIVLNIGLRTNTDKSEISSFLAVNQILDKFGTKKEVSFKIAESSYDGEDEKCLIVGIYENISTKELEKKLKVLCSALLQDCISYYDMQTGLGDLVWNDQIKPYLSFDKDYMKF